MNKETTITIDSITASKIQRFTTLNGLTKKEFIKVTIDYLDRNGINPKEHESAAKEMNKLIKRIDQIIGFIKVQEKDILKPACEAIFKNEIRLSEKINVLSTKKEIQDVEKKINMMIQSFSILEKKIENIGKSQEKGLLYIAKLIDAKEKSGVFKDIAKAYDEL